MHLFNLISLKGKEYNATVGAENFLVLITKTGLDGVTGSAVEMIDASSTEIN
jgi:hypothetical protein